MRGKKILFIFYTAGTKSEESVGFLTFVPLQKKQLVRFISFRDGKSGFVSRSVMMEGDKSHIRIRCSILHFLVLFFDWF